MLETRVDLNANPELSGTGVAEPCSALLRNRPRTRRIVPFHMSDTSGLGSCSTVQILCFVGRAKLLEKLMQPGPITVKSNDYRKRYLEHT
jgi:hypothetical protein